MDLLKTQIELLKKEQELELKFNIDWNTEICCVNCKKVQPIVKPNKENAMICKVCGRNPYEAYSKLYECVNCNTPQTEDTNCCKICRRNPKYITGGRMR